MKGDFYFNNDQRRWEESPEDEDFQEKNE